MCDSNLLNSVRADRARILRSSRLSRLLVAACLACLLGSQPAAADPLQLGPFAVADIFETPGCLPSCAFPLDLGVLRTFSYALTPGDQVTDILIEGVWGGTQPHSAPVEVYLEGRGWTTYDPTPASQAALGPGEGVLADLHALLDALRTRWMTSVVGYDLRTQGAILRNISNWIAQRQGPRDNKQARDEFDLNWLKELRPRPAVIALLALSALGWLLWRFRHRLWGDGSREVPARAAEAVRLYRDLERAMARRGHGRTQTDTPYEHAEKLQRQGFPHSEEVRVVTETYMEVRFGDRALSGEQLSQLREAVSRVSHNRPPADL